MPHPVRRIPAKQLRRDYPIRRSLGDWYFRVTETSAGAWRAEGVDPYGRKVACDGIDPEAALETCEAYARSLGQLHVP